MDRRLAAAVTVVLCRAMEPIKPLPPLPPRERTHPRSPQGNAPGATGRSEVKRLRPHHELGARVVIYRHRHGWLGGAARGVITEKHPRPTGSCGYTVTADDGSVYDVQHTRDLRVIDKKRENAA